MSYIPLMALAVAMFGAVFGVFVYVPDDKWDNAAAIGVCSGLAILRQENGTVWLRVSGARAYQIEDVDKLICR
jgi:hypothetical protein